MRPTCKTPSARWLAMTDQAEAKSLPGNIALIRASNAQNQGNLAETVKYAELSLQLIPEDDFYLRAQAVITLEFIHWATGNLEASLRAMYAWTEDMQRSGNQVFVIASAFAVADMQVTLGHLGEAEKTLRQAIQQAAALGREAELVTAHHHLGLALLAHERGDETAAAQHLQTAADLGQRTTLVDWPHRWNLAQARLKESAGEWDAALDLLDEARRGYVKNRDSHSATGRSPQGAGLSQTRAVGQRLRPGRGSGAFRSGMRSATWTSTTISPWPGCGWPKVPSPGSTTCWNACWHWQKRKNGRGA